VLDLPRFERDAEAFCRAAGRARYLAAAGVETAPELESLYADYTHLFRDDTFGELGEAELEPRPKRYLLEFVARGYLAEQVRAYDEQIAARMAVTTIEWDEQALPLRSVPIVLANEPDAWRRHELAARRGAALAALNPIWEERHRTLLESTTRLGNADYATLRDTLGELHLADLYEAAQAFLGATQEVYFDALAEQLGTVGVARADAAPCDLRWLFRAPQFDVTFAPRALVPSLYRTMRGVGVDLEAQSNLHFDFEANTSREPGAACIPLEVPDDVRLVFRPLGGRLDFSALYAATGRAEAYAAVDRTQPLAFRWLGDDSVGRGHGLLFAHLLADPRWLERYLELDHPADVVRLALFERLYHLRRACATLEYARALNQGQDYDALALHYAEVFGAALGIEHAPEAFLADGGDGFDAAVDFRAWIFEAQHRRFLAKEFDEEWFRVPRAGRFLRDLWREGQKHPVEELARFMGYQGLDLRPLTDELMVGAGL
jgi:hypothetical protein